MKSSLVGSSSFPSRSSWENYVDIGVERWLIAEKTAHKVIAAVQPTVVSNGKRYEIINYIRGLIREVVGDEVMAYGSMPLKTYLPDGDIDLTIFSSEDDVKRVATSISAILGAQKSHESPIMDVLFVDAKVKIVKCLVQRVPVDISFNQIDGLNSLCFLEQIDQHIGRDHLFKRSIILIKAWCFYESRLLGSHCSLMATYALEILILYIINLFHSSLTGPFAVFYKFLDYYSKFNWDRFCISLNGPVYLNSLPKVVVDTSAIRDTNLLLSENFLESCIRSLSVAANVYQTETQRFRRKHMNIIDPLKVENNLGCSISQASFYRIILAFSYGCQQFSNRLQLPVEKIGDGLMKLFTNTCGKSPRGKVLDGEVAALGNESRMCYFSDLKGDYYCPIESLNYAMWYINFKPAIFQLPGMLSSPWLMQSQSVENQVTHNTYYPGGIDGFASSSLYYPNAYPVAAYLGQSMSIPPVSSKGKFKLSASAPPFVSSKVKCEGTGLFVPRVDVKRRPEPEETGGSSSKAQHSEHRTNFSEMIMKRTGLSQKTPMENRMVNTGSGLDRVRGSIRFNLSGEELNLPPSCEMPTGSGKDAKSGWFDLSLEHFPLLPSRKKVIQAEKPSEIQLSRDSFERSTETDKGGKSSCLDLSLEHLSLLPSFKKAIQSEKPNKVQLSRDSCEKSAKSDKEGESGCLDLSLEHFPLLASCKKATQLSAKPNVVPLTGDSGRYAKHFKVKEESSSAQ